MQKLLPLAVTAVIGALVAARRTRARRAEQELWAEATRPIDLR